MIKITLSKELDASSVGDDVMLLHVRKQLEIGYTFLPCVLAGLSCAPQYKVRKFGSSDRGCILASDVDSVILPIDACGGDGTLAFARNSNKVESIVLSIISMLSGPDDESPANIEAAVFNMSWWIRLIKLQVFAHKR